MPIYIMSRKIKKLTLQYEYLKLEKEEVLEACKSVETEIREFIKKNYPEHYKTFYGDSEPPDNKEESENSTLTPHENVPATPSEEMQNSEGLEEESESANPKNPDLKKLFRKIIEKTHPDKVGDNRYASLFADAVDAYDRDDIGRLLEIAGEINVELAALSVESLLLLESNIQELFKEIQRKKQTTGWSWHNATSEEDKKIIIESILKYKGVSL